MTEQQFNKLPKFAQSEIRGLRSDLEVADKKIGEIFGGEETNTLIWNNMDIRPLPNNSSIRFKLQNRNYIDIGVVDNILRIYGNRGVSILPRAANSIYLTIEDK